MPIMNLKLETRIIQFRPCEMVTKVYARTFRDDITLTITKTQIDKYYRE